MARFQVTRDIPVTVNVEAEDWAEARDKADFTPAWDILFGRHGEGMEELTAAGFTFGEPYDLQSDDVVELDDDGEPLR